MANKVSKGQPLKSAPTLKASFINDLVDVVNAYKGGGLGGRSGTTAGGKGWPLKVRNLTGADRSRGEVVQLGELLLNKLDPRNLWFEGNTPSEKPTERFAILAAPLPANDIGPVHLSGVCVAKVNVTDVEHGYAVPEESSYVLKSAESGPVEILSPVTNTGEQECAVLLGVSNKNATRCNALLSAAYTSGDPTATVNNVVPLDGTSPVEDAEDELEVTVYTSGWDDATVGTKCKIEWNATDERWEMYDRDC